MCCQHMIISKSVTPGKDSREFAGTLGEGLYVINGSVSVHTGVSLIEPPQ